MALPLSPKIKGGNLKLKTDMPVGAPKSKPKIVGGLKKSPKSSSRKSA